jgi:hypothetical protein
MNLQVSNGEVIVTLSERNLRALVAGYRLQQQVNYTLYRDVEGGKRLRVIVESDEDHYQVRSPGSDLNPLVLDSMDDAF